MAGEDDHRAKTPELSVEALRELSNVVRVRAYLALRAFGRLRARQVADLTGISEGSMSTHLEVLREIGLVNVDREGRTRRTWVWSAVPGGFDLGRLEGGEKEDAALAWLRAMIGVQGITATQWASVAPKWPQAWRSAAETSDWVLHLTAQQLDELAADLRGVVRKWKPVGDANEAIWADQQTTPTDPEWIAPVVVITDAMPYPREPE